MIFYFIPGKIQNPPCTIICFDYGGYYMKDRAEIKWISRDGEGGDEIHTIVLKKSVEEVTYSALVECICRKLKVDESKMERSLVIFQWYCIRISHHISGMMKMFLVIYCELIIN